MRPGKAIFIFGLLMVASFLGFIPVQTQATSPSFTVNSFKHTQGGQTAHIAITTTAGDIIYVGVIEQCTSQLGSLQYSDSQGNFYAPIAVEQIIPAICGAGSAGALEIHDTKTTATGTDTVTVFYNTGAGCIPFCNDDIWIWDITGVLVSDVGNQVICTSGCTASMSLPPYTFNPSNSFLLALGFPVSTTNNSPGYFTFHGTILGGTQAGIVNSTAAVSSPTTFPMTRNGGAGSWAEVVDGATFSAPVVLIPCNFFQVQCWMYPLLMMSLVGGLMFAAVEPSRPSKEAITYILLASFTFTSAVEVLMGLLPITMPLLLTVIMVVYAWRFR